MLFPLFDPHVVISEHSRSLTVKSVANCIFANQNDLKGRRCSLPFTRLSSSCWHLVANTTACAVHTNVNTHKKAFTRTLKSHTAEFSEANVFDLCITTRMKLQWGCGGMTHTHSRYASGLDENLGSRLTQSAGSDHAAGADGKWWGLMRGKGDERYAEMQLSQISRCIYSNNGMMLVQKFLF